MNTGAWPVDGGMSLKTYVDPRGNLLVRFFVRSRAREIAVLRLAGEVAENSTNVSELLTTLRALRSRPLAGTVLQISTSGGSIAVAQEITSEILFLRQATAAPIYVVLGDTVLSAGLYVAMAADRIFCQPGSVLGSIGGIYSHWDAAKVTEMLGVRCEVIKSGDQKDILSPWARLTAAAHESLQVLVDDVHDQFVRWIEQRRGPRLTQEREWQDGRLFSGRAGLVYGFVDELGGFGAALRHLQTENRIETSELLYFSSRKQEPVVSLLQRINVQTLARALLARVV